MAVAQVVKGGGGVREGGGEVDVVIKLVAAEQYGERIKLN